MTDRAPTHAASRWARAIDPLIFAGLFLGYLGALVASARGIGYARDEGFYFHAAATYGKWFELLVSSPERALAPATVDRFWQENHEHPALMKSLFWLSQRLLDGRVPLGTGTTLRLPAMAISALGVATTFAFGRRAVSRGAGVFAALSFGLMPSIFHNSHLACFDMPIAAFWLFVVYAYHRSLEPRAWGWALGCAVLYGLALDTKHNSWLLPPAILAHALLLALPGCIRRVRERARERDGADGGAARPPLPVLRVPLAIPLTLLIAPLVFYALWPWIWHGTWPRLVEYFEFHRQHVYYNIEFLGRTYFEPPFPRSYSWLMTLATVPLITLLLAVLGAVGAGRAAVRGAAGAATARDAGDPRDPRHPYNWALLWLLCILASYFMWLFSGTPIFGGTKHWLSAYPFLALFAGRGFDGLVSLIKSCWRDAESSELLERPRANVARQALTCGLGVCTLIGPLVMTWHSVPWGLSAYMPIVGGAPGAASLGLNRSFWGYTTGSVTGYLNESMARGERLFLHDTAFDSFRMLQRDHRLRGDIKPWTTVSGSRVALYHHEQHMSRVEHMIWVDYGTTAPADVATFDGVPMIWVYRRP